MRKRKGVMPPKPTFVAQSWLLARACRFSLSISRPTRRGNHCIRLIGPLHSLSRSLVLVNSVVHARARASTEIHLILLRIRNAMFLLDGGRRLLGGLSGHAEQHAKALQICNRLRRSLLLLSRLHNLLGRGESSAEVKNPWSTNGHTCQTRY
jgi:hypothetical protein